MTGNNPITLISTLKIKNASQINTENLKGNLESEF